MSAQSVLANIAGVSIVLFVLLFPPCAFVGLFRFITIQPTKEIDALCAIDRLIRMPLMAMPMLTECGFPGRGRAADVGFFVPPRAKGRDFQQGLAKKDRLMAQPMARSNQQKTGSEVRNK
jgi:hypothetical protein